MPHKKPWPGIDWTLCAVADVEAAEARYLPSLVEAAVTAGATLVQLRAKTLDTADFFALACRVQAAAGKSGAPLLINDRVDIALACDAAGVHLGQKDLPLSSARRLLGRKKIIGISVASVEEAVTAQAGGADYLGVGPVYFTSSKADLPKILGTEGIKAIRAAVELPLLAIGGITAARAREVAETGVDGVAVISALWGAEDIPGATRELLEAFDPGVRSWG
jgi:thiamine-phosphate pyrophosphorylase